MTKLVIKLSDKMKEMIALEWACEKGHLDIVERIIAEKKTHGFTNACMTGAIKGKHAKVISCLLEHCFHVKQEHKNLAKSTKDKRIIGLVLEPWDDPDWPHAGQDVSEGFFRKHVPTVVLEGTLG